jgi:serine/threonine-protein kinase
MSPEQARGDAELGARSDVWSLAVVLYELVTGQLPFDGDNYNALLWAIGHDEPRPIMDWGSGDPRLSAILQRGLKKQPSERWDTMRSLGEQLAAWLHAQGVREDVCGASLRATWLEGTALDPGPDPNLLEVHTLSPGPRTASPDLEVILVETPEPGTGVFARPHPPVARPPEVRRRWLVAAGAALLVGLGATLLLSTRSRVSPTGPTHGEPAASVELEPQQLGHAARTDLALPMLVASGVSSEAVPSAEPSADPASKRAPPATRYRASRKIVPERYDLGF